MPFNGSTFSFSLFAFFLWQCKQTTMSTRTHTHTKRWWLWKLVWVDVSVIRRQRRRTNASRTWASISEGRTAAQSGRERKEVNEDITRRADTHLHTHTNTVLAIPLKCFELGSITCCLCTVKIAVKNYSNTSKLSRTLVATFTFARQQRGNAAYAWYSLAILAPTCELSDS